MDTKDISAVLLKTIGLVMIAYSIFELPLYFLPNSSAAEQFSFLAIFVQAAAALALPIVLGLLLWFFPATITNKIVSGEKLSGDHFGASDLERVALTVVGAWLIAYGIADLIYSLSLLIFTRREFAEQSPPVIRYMPGIVTSIVKVAVGVGLAIGAKGISRLVKRARGEA